MPAANGSSASIAAVQFFCLRATALSIDPRHPVWLEMVISETFLMNLSSTALVRSTSSFRRPSSRSIVW